MVSIARGGILLSAILISVVFAVGCGGQSEGSSGEDPAPSKPASTQPDKTTSQPMESKARAGNGPKESQKKAAPSDKGAEARAGNAVAGDGEARAGNIVAGDGGGGEAEARAGNASRTGKVRLRISGTQGAEFRGSCVVGGEKEEDISGQVPEHFVYRLDGGRLECGIRSRGPGTLQVALIGGGTRAIQAINSGQGAVNLIYSSSGVSVSSR